MIDPNPPEPKDSAQPASSRKLRASSALTPRQTYSGSCTAIDRIYRSRLPQPPREKKITCGTVSGYQAGCKCPDCKDASAAARRRTRANHNARKAAS